MSTSIQQYSVADYHKLGLKSRLKTVSRKTRRAMANDFSALNPTIWANEAIVQLLPNMVIANLISRDFDTKMAKFGDVVNAYIPGNFEMTRKGALCENVVVQDASGASLQVPLDQWPQVSFLICDGEEDRPALDLIDTLLSPAMLALAQGADRILGGQVYQFLDNVSGHANNVDETNIKRYLLEARENMNRRNVPLAGRTMLLTPATETEALTVEAFTNAAYTGDNGGALRDATIGRKYGWDLFMTQTQPEISAGQSTVGTVLINDAAGFAAGTTVLTVDGAGATATLVGQWAVVAGDDTPQHITARTDTTLTVTPGLKRNVANNAVVTILKSGAVNLVAGYVGTTSNPRVIGWAKEILMDGLAASAPQIGQMVSFGSQTQRYAIIKLTIYDLAAGTFGITLDRPLELPIANNATVNLGPAARYNFGFVRNAFTLVTRPLPQPRAGTGAISRVVVDPVNKISIRVTITYDGQKQGHLVTLDFLMGVGVLSQDMGEVMLG